MNEQEGMEIVKRHFPDIDNELSNFILWEYTGFPCFWSTKDHKSECESQIKEYKKLKDTGKQPCSVCGSEAVKKGFCQTCYNSYKNRINKNR